MVAVPPNRFAPKCAHPGCDAWASWGYGCTKEIGSGRWYCTAHRPSDEVKATPIEHVQPVDARPNAGPPDAMPNAGPKRFAGGLF